MDNQFELLKQNDFFASLTHEELAQCYKLMTPKNYMPGQYIINQGDIGKEIFFIVEGSVDVLQKKSDSSQAHHLTALKAGDVFGELALIDQSARSSSIKALEPTHTLTLSESALQQLFENTVIYKKLSRNLLLKLSGRLRYTNDVTVTSLERQLELTKTQLIAGNFTVMLIVILALFTFLLGAMTYLTKLLGTASMITTSAVLLLLVVFWIGAKHTGYPASFFGFTLKNWRRAVYEGIIFTLPILALITIVKWGLIHYVPIFSGIELFSLGKTVVANPNVHTSPLTITLMLFAYVFISSPIQEILFRGGLQGSLQFFLLNKHRNLLANVTANLVFAMVHLILSYILALMALAMGLFMGWLYDRHKTLVGVILSHMLIGTWVFFILGIQSLVMAAR